MLMFLIILYSGKYYRNLCLYAKCCRSGYCIYTLGKAIILCHSEMQTLNIAIEYRMTEVG